MSQKNTTKSPSRGRTTRQASAAKDQDLEKSNMPGSLAPPSANTHKEAQTSIRQYTQTVEQGEAAVQTSASSDLMKAIEAKLELISKQLNTMASKEYINKKIDKLVTVEGLELSLVKVKESISAEFMVELKKTNEEVEKLRSDLHDVSIENENMKKQIEKLEEKESSSADTIQALDAKAAHLAFINHELEQYTRADSIRIYGVDDQLERETNEQCEQKVLSLLNNKLGMKATKSDISIAHRLGKFDKAANRPVICKFARRTVKLDVLRNIKKLKGSSIVIKEDISQSTKMFMDNLQLESTVTSVWMWDNKVYVKRVWGRIHRIRHWDDLQGNHVETHM